MENISYIIEQQLPDDEWIDSELGKYSEEFAARRDMNFYTQFMPSLKLRIVKLYTVREVVE